VVTDERRREYAEVCKAVVNWTSGRHDIKGVAVSEPAELVRTREWGPLMQRRIRLAAGLEIEFGFTPRHWAESDPVDPETARVVLGGCPPILDRGGLPKKLIEAV